METGEIFISNKDGVHHIRVKGNASFVCAPPLRELAKKLPAEPFNGIKIDLEECTWMDSTFMGMLAMLGLSARKKSVPAEIFNASEQNEKLLCGLGLNKVFEFKLGEFEAAAGAAASNATTPESNAHNVLDAHQTLMDIDINNVPKFEKVVEFVKKDIDRMEGKPQN
ncbi:MAG: STAS domain-containing protein [Kiritimatiellae bacterium]|nr:STAS domain-containing protein [Kiritimatiellia bacterium]